MKDMVAVIVTARNFMVSLYGLLWEVGGIWSFVR